MRPIISFLPLIIVISSWGQVTVNYETLINGQGDFHDQFLDVTQDGSGNTYTIGSTMTTGEDRNILLVKWNSQGQQEWSWEYSGNGLGPDEGKRVKMLPDGRIVVAGYVNTRSVGNDFFLAVLNNAGDTSWTRIFNDATTNLYDEVNDLEIDASGNIYVTGDSDSDPTAFTNNDMLTVKYNAAGVFQWSARYNAISNNNDRSFGITLDNSGNVYIAGRTFNGNNDDFILIQYNNIGVQQWIRTFNNGATDRAIGVVSDNNGLIYVAGRSDNGIDDDYRVIQYNNAGTIQWNTVYNNAGDDRPSAIEVIPSGGCVITGKSDGNPTTVTDYNIVTVKYSASGAQQWVKTYAGTAATEDIPTSLSRNANGEIAVAGNTGLNSIYNGVSLLYNDAGTNLITQIYNGGILNDEINGVFATGNGQMVSAGFRGLTANNREAVLLKYTSNTAPLVSTHSGQGDNTDNIRAVASGTNGNLYFCGYTVYPDSSRDFWVGALNNTGTQLWSYRKSGSLFGSDEEANSIVLDASNNVYVSGYIKNAGTSSDLFIAKFNSTGTLLWNIIIDGIHHESDRIYALAIDASGNIYVTGKSDTDVSWQVNDEITTVKVSNAGIVQWTQTFAGIGMGSDRGVLIRVGTNAVYVAGKRVNTTDDIIVLKYSLTGVLQWNYTLTLDNGNDAINDMWLDANGNVYLAGEAERILNSGDVDGFIASISSAGIENWVRYIGSQGVNTERTVTGLLASNQLHVVSNIDGNTSAVQNTDIRYSIYDIQGNLLSETDYATEMEETATRIFLHSGGAAFVTANTYQISANDLDIKADIIVFSNGAGTLAYSRNTSDSIDFFATGQLVGNILYTGGSSYTINGKRDAFLGKYAVASPTPGCTDIAACNYNPSATVNDNSCNYPTAIPIFNAFSSYCSGAAISALPTTSNNGITGSWSPAINNTNTTNYTFTPNVGQCALTTTAAITIIPNTTPTFTPTNNYCNGANIPELPTTSLNGITGTWTPAINNSTTTNYTFTPTAGQCATTATTTITIIPNVTPTFATISNYCDGAIIPALSTISLNGISGSWSPQVNNTTTTNYTFTPLAGQCATAATTTIVIIPNVMPTFTLAGPYCQGTNIQPLPTTSLNGISGSWTPAINSLATTEYMFTPLAGECATTTHVSVEIDTPPFAGNDVSLNICSGANAFSLFNYLGANVDTTGEWSGSTTLGFGHIGELTPNAQSTGIYHYIVPNNGACQSDTALVSVIITDNNNAQIVYPTHVCGAFSEYAAPYLSGSAGGIFSTDSNALIIDTTSGIVNVLASNPGTYTITYSLPQTGGCNAFETQTTIQIDSILQPIFSGINQLAYCTGDNIPSLPLTSDNGIQGTWTPQPNNTTTTQYIFSPQDACATTSAITIQIQDQLIPVFDFPTNYCLGASIPPLPNTSINGITGSWTPEINSIATTEYLFTPGNSSCAENFVITIHIQLAGCTDSLACNFNPNANCDDANCTYPDCLDSLACNFNPIATCADSSCVYPGCYDSLAFNFDPQALCNGTCIYAGCTDSLACNFDAFVSISDSSCTYPLAYYNCAGNCLNDNDGNLICDELEVVGCTDTLACNYNSTATTSDNSCEFPGCNSNLACNYDSSAGCDDGSCIWPGCMDSSACNYSADVICSSGLCFYPGCSSPDACNYDTTAGCDDGSCLFPGCMNPDACNYDPVAACDNNSCISSGCILADACNYDATAGCNDLSCNPINSGIIFSDNIETYATNVGITVQSVNWALWQNTSVDAMATNIDASSGSQSMNINGINNHILLRTQDYTDGILDLTFDLSVVQNGASISMLRTYTSPTQVERGLTLVIDNGSLMNVIAGDTALINALPIITWNHFELHVDMHHDSAWLTMNGDTLARWPWSLYDVSGLAGNNAFAGIELRGMNTAGNNAQFLLDAFSMTYTDFHDCNENCIHDLNQDGVCDEYETLPTQLVEITEENYLIYPNPTKGMIYISRNQTPLPSELTVRDLTGRILMRSIHAGYLDLSGFAAGAYFIDAQNTYGKKTIRIIKE